MENADKPINPSISSIENGDGNLCAVFTENGNAGLTKREYFAGLFLQGILSNNSLLIELQKESLRQKKSSDLSEIVSKSSLVFADELLEQLEKK